VREEKKAAVFNSVFLLLLTGSKDNTCRIWKASTGKL